MRNKMNVTKSRAGVFLFILALLLLAACGGGSDKSEPAAATAVQPTEPPVSGGD
jgi:hypothetical protein